MAWTNSILKNKDLSNLQNKTWTLQVTMARSYKMCGFLMSLALSSCSGATQRQRLHPASKRTLITELPPKPDNFPRLPQVEPLDTVTLGVAGLVVGSFTTAILYHTYPEWLGYPEPDFPKAEIDLPDRKKDRSLTDYMWYVVLCLVALLYVVLSINVFSTNT